MNKRHTLFAWSGLAGLCLFFMLDSFIFAYAEDVKAGEISVTDAELDAWSGSLTNNEVNVTFDRDQDGLSDDREYDLGTDPLNPDTDGDCLKDGEEVYRYGTKPLVPDTDGDRLYDGAEVFGYDAWSVKVQTDGQAWASPGPSARWLTYGAKQAGLADPFVADLWLGAKRFDSIRIALAGFVLFGPDANTDFLSQRVNLSLSSPGLVNMAAVCWDEYCGGKGVWAEASGVGTNSRVVVTWVGTRPVISGNREGLDFQMEYSGSDRSYSFRYRKAADIPFPDALCTVGLKGNANNRMARVLFNRLGFIKPGMTVILKPAVSDPLDANSDHDGVPFTDGEEADFGWDPAAPEEWGSDADGDSLNWFEELWHDTDPLNADTDGDDLLDGEEVAYGLDPGDMDDVWLDFDWDGLNNAVEWCYRTDPWNPDSDSDFKSDCDEIAQGSNPVDPTDGGMAPEQSVTFYLFVDTAAETGLGGTTFQVANWRLTSHLFRGAHGLQVVLPRGVACEMFVYTRQGLVQCPGVKTDINTSTHKLKEIPDTNRASIGSVIVDNMKSAFGSFPLVLPLRNE